MNATMPTRQDFAKASSILRSRGFEHIGSMMVNDAHKSDVVDFGLKFIRFADEAKFWLNFKTIRNLTA